jgi:hypothetical protein
MKPAVRNTVVALDSAMNSSKDVIANLVNAKIRRDSRIPIYAIAFRMEETVILIYANHVEVRFNSH